MKKVSSLLSAIFLVGVMYAQNTDTIPNQPNPGNQPSLKDTTPGLRTDTMPSWRRDSLNWNKDSLKGKWNDSLNSGNFNQNDSKKWEDSTNANLNQNQNNETNQPGNLNTTDSLSNSGNQQDSSSSLNENKANNNTSDPSTATSKKSTKSKKVMSDRVMMKDGEMVIIKKGEETKLEKSITLPDGNVVTADGTVKMPDGNSVKLKDGEYISLSPKKKTTTTKKATTKKSKS